MARDAWQEEVSGSAMPLDLTVDPNVAGNKQYPADWVELTGGGTLTYLDGSGQSQTLTNTAAGYTVQSPNGFRKLVSLSGASPNMVRVGKGLGPKLNYDASAASSASAASGSASAAASSATAAASSATAAASSATAAAASASGIAGDLLTPSTTVITADPAPAVIGTFYDCDPSSASFSLTLPAIGSGNHGKRIGINVVTTSSNHVTPVPNGTDTLPANLATVAGTYGRAILMADNGPSPKAWRLAGQ